LCRQLLGQPPPAEEPRNEPTAALMLRLTGIDIALCPLYKKGRLHVAQILAPADHSNRSPAVFDSS